VPGPGSGLAAPAFQLQTLTAAVRIPYQTFRLANGLFVTVSEDHTAPLVAVNLWYHVGSANERDGRTGFAHLFEHMLFQGSAHVGSNEHFELIQRAGGTLNGSTWVDRTNYYETIPSNQLGLALWLEADRMGQLLPAMTQQKLDTQRDVVKNERRWSVDNQPYGTRIPLLAIGRFAQKGTVSHVQMEHSSIVKFLEWNYLGGKTGQLGARDTVVNNIGSLLDPTQTGTMVPDQ